MCVDIHPKRVGSAIVATKSLAGIALGYHPGNDPESTLALFETQDRRLQMLMEDL